MGSGVEGGRALRTFLLLWWRGACWLTLHTRSLAAAFVTLMLLLLLLLALLCLLACCFTFGCLILCTISCIITLLPYTALATLLTTPAASTGWGNKRFKCSSQNALHSCRQHAHAYDLVGGCVTSGGCVMRNCSKTNSGTEDPMK